MNQMKTPVKLVNGAWVGPHNLDHTCTLVVGNWFYVEGTRYTLMGENRSGWEAAVIEKLPTTGVARMTHEDRPSVRWENHCARTVELKIHPEFAFAFEFDAPPRERGEVYDSSEEEWFGASIKYGASREDVAETLERLAAAIRSGAGVKGTGDRIGREVSLS